MPTYAIGDIHGHLDLLAALHVRIAEDMARHGAGPVVHLGDLVDRGPNSQGVIDHLSRGIERGENWVVIKGNHDRMFARFMANPLDPEPGLRSDLAWLHPRLGGAETLASYGVPSPHDHAAGRVHANALRLVPEAHIAFINALPTWYETPDAIFVHAGIRPGVAMPDQTETDLVWIRTGFLDDPRDHGALIVHGHTALDAPTHYGNRLNIDSGAAYGGPLTAVVLDAGAVFHLTAQGRVPLLPTPVKHARW